MKVGTICKLKVDCLLGNKAGTLGVVFNDYGDGNYDGFSTRMQMGGSGRDPIELLDEIYKYDSEGGRCPVCKFTVCTDDCRFHRLISLLRAEEPKLHPSKKRREDCADCPYPDRNCDDCINKARPEEPEAGEFTKKFREDLALYIPIVDRMLINKGFKACDIIDHQATEKNTILNRLIDMNCALIGWREKTAFDSEDDLIGELERMVNEAIEKHKSKT